MPTTPHETLGSRLYRGEVSYDFIGRARTWYAASGVIMLVSILALAVRWLNFGIEFEGGVVFTPPANGHSVSEARDIVEGLVEGEARVQEIQEQGGEKRLRIQTEELPPEQVTKVADALTRGLGVSADDLNTQEVGASWGREISKKALQGLIVFLFVIVIFLSIYFEFKLAVGALVALVHDVVITIGVYSLVGFEVTPATVIGLLTILGYSLYDTVVVFDKVRENTKGLAGGSRMTYSQAANLAVNQTLVRSINTSVIGLLPVAALLFIGAFVLGAGTLKDLALALFVGMAAGTYSSIFIATPVAAQLKEKEPQFQALAKRVAARTGGGGPSPRTGRAAEARTPTATSTAVLEREDAPGETLDGDDDVPPPPRPAAVAAPRPQGGAGKGPGRSQNKKRKGGRGGRPGGRKRR